MLQSFLLASTISLSPFFHFFQPRDFCYLQSSSLMGLVILVLEKHLLKFHRLCACCLTTDVCCFEWRNSTLGRWTAMDKPTLQGAAARNAVLLTIVRIQRMSRLIWDGRQHQRDQWHLTPTARPHRIRDWPRKSFPGQSKTNAPYLQSHAIGFGSPQWILHLPAQN